MIIVLPHDTVARILDHASATSGAAPKARRRRATGPPTSEARHSLSENIVGALNQAQKAKANLVGPLEASDFNALSAWCRDVGLTKDGEIVEAAVRASG